MVPVLSRKRVRLQLEFLQRVGKGHRDAQSGIHVVMNPAVQRVLDARSLSSSDRNGNLVVTASAVSEVVRCLDGCS